MNGSQAGAVTELLHRWSGGDADALNLLAELSYRDLRRLAATYLRSESPDQSYLTEDLVNESFIRLMGQNRVEWRDRGHFLAVASRLMRRVLIDHARRKYSAKRGGRSLRITLSALSVRPAEAELLNLDEALTALETYDDELRQIVELRYFGGFAMPEIAASLSLSLSTAFRRLRLARAWLARFMDSHD